ncbi:MAG: hypothetical protein J6Y96_01310 [Mycoplasma sp.]|nr:hypothetical protein [Mycoplasma sp.]
MKKKLTGKLNKNINDSTKKILVVDPSYKYKRYWRLINNYFYCAISISFILFLNISIFSLIQKNLDVVKILGMVFGFLSLGLLTVAWILIIFFNGPIKYTNQSQNKLKKLYEKQNKLMISYRIIFFSLTIIPTFMLIFATNIIDLYFIECIFTIYLALSLFTILAIIVILIYINYLKNKKTMYESI